MKLLKNKMWIALIVLAIVLLAACGKDSDSNNASNPASVSPSADSSPNGNKSEAPQKIVFWHAMGGDNTRIVEELTARFNASQSAIEVEAIYQGTYDDLLSKLRTSMGSKEAPAIVQVYEIGSRFMIDTGAITPIQKFIEEENFDISALEPNIAGYYTFDNQLFSMPFNTSNPLLYYNKDLFREAGLDPENPPTTFEGVREAAEAIVKTGKADGITIQINGWFMEQLFANQNAEYVNNGNGRHGLATESLVNSEPGVKVLSWWKSMLDDGLLINLGRTAGDPRKAFASGQLGMMLDTTAALKRIVAGAEDKYEVGTGFLPKFADTPDGGGIVVGGASLYIMNDRPEEEQKAAWEFIKSISSPEEQAFWHINTGYFPITVQSYELDDVKSNMEEFPQFRTAVEQLHQTTLSVNTQGAVMGVFPEARKLVEAAIEEVLNNRKSPQEALDEAAKQITNSIEQYNRTVQR